MDKVRLGDWVKRTLREKNASIIVGSGTSVAFLMEEVCEHLARTRDVSKVRIDVVDESTGRPAPDVPGLHAILVGELPAHLAARIDTRTLDMEGQAGALDEVLANPDCLYRLDPLHFEDFVAAIYTRLGYAVFFTKRSHDGGVDLLMVKDIDGMRHRYIVQCKHTVVPSKKLGVEPVRELLGSFLDWAATACIMVTNMLFSPDASDLASRHAQHCFCVDKPQLLNLLHKATSA